MNSLIKRSDITLVEPTMEVIPPYKSKSDTVKVLAKLHKIPIYRFLLAEIKQETIEGNVIDDTTLKLGHSVD